MIVLPRSDDRIDVIRAIKCVSAPTFPHPIRIAQKAGTGELEVSDQQPDDRAENGQGPD